MTYAVIQIRGTNKTNRDIKDTLKLLNLTRANHCILIPGNDVYNGMLQKVKDYVTWGEVDSEIIAKLIMFRGKLTGNKPITDEYIKNCTQYRSIYMFAQAIEKNEFIYKNLKDVKPIFRLHPPRGGFEHTKKAFPVGGALGYRGKNVKELLMRMIINPRKKVKKLKILAGGTVDRRQQTAT